MQDTSSHPTPDELYLYQAEMAPVDDIERIEKHLLLCQQCRDKVDRNEREHPEPAALDLYAIGRLNGPIGNGIKLHLSHCGWCSETLGARAEKVAQVRHGLNILIGHGAAAHPEHAPEAAKLTRPPEPQQDVTEESFFSIPELAKPAREQEPVTQPKMARERKTQFDLLSLDQDPAPAAPRLDAPAPRESGSERHMSGFAYYLLGRKLGAVQTQVSFQTLSDAYDALHDLLDRKDLALPTAQPIAHELSRSLREAMLVDSDEGALRSLLNPDRLKAPIRRFENALEDDLERVGPLPLEPRANDELQSLVDHPESVFPSHMWGELSQNAQQHWSEATRCLAYRLPTATAFHALRTLESVVNLYLERTGVPLRPRSLQDGLELLKKQAANSKAVELAVHLTTLHCNPLQKADCFVSGEEGVDQFDLCTIAIKAFLRDMERRQLVSQGPFSAQPSLYSNQ